MNTQNDTYSSYKTKNQKSQITTWLSGLARILYGLGWLLFLALLLLAFYPQAVQWLQSIGVQPNDHRTLFVQSNEPRGGLR